MKRVLVSTRGDEETIAVVAGRGVTEVLHGPSDDSRHLGNIYRGVVVTVDARLQSAFVDFGLDWDGFLHISNVHESYGDGRSQRDQSISDLLDEDQDVLVQLNRDKRRTNDFALTTHLSLPGRYLVLMPGSPRLAVSKKIVDERERRRLKDVLKGLEPPESLGYVIRTEGVGANEEALSADLAMLLDLWRKIHDSVRNSDSPSLIYAEHNFVFKTLRNLVDDDVDEVVFDDDSLSARVERYLPILVPEFEGDVTLHDSSRPLLQKYGVGSGA